MKRQRYERCRREDGVVDEFGSAGCQHFAGGGVSLVVWRAGWRSAEGNSVGRPRGGFGASEAESLPERSSGVSCDGLAAAQSMLWFPLGAEKKNLVKDAAGVKRKGGDL